MFTRLFEFFSEDSGRASSMRLMAFETVQVGLAIALILAIRGADNQLELIGLSLGLITLGLTGKIMQKTREAPAEPEK